MRTERPLYRSRLKGYMWECVILRLLNENDFIEVVTIDDVRIRRQRSHFLELRGRGAWHQIDCCCDYRQFIPFINPIRLLGEVKFISGPIQKHFIREFIGVIKDIQENYFITDSFFNPTERYTELGVYFSANGFSSEAEQLAFAHNIKTLSYNNISVLEPLKLSIYEIEQNYLFAEQCLSQNNQTDFIRLFRAILSKEVDAIPSFVNRFRPANGFARLAEILVESFGKIKSNFVANSSGGAMLHFISKSVFPAELFMDTDKQLCEIYYERLNRGMEFYLVFSGDRENRRFYFNPPSSLSNAVFFGPKATLDAKEHIFRSLHIARTIDGLARNLVLELNNDWLELARRQDE